jgi:hypothetical protein
MDEGPLLVPNLHFLHAPGFLDLSVSVVKRGLLGQQRDLHYRCDDRNDCVQDVESKRLAKDNEKAVYFDHH